MPTSTLFAALVVAVILHPMDEPNADDRGSAVSADTILDEYLDLPFPEEDRLGEFRILRLNCLERLKTDEKSAVAAIGRRLPTLKRGGQRAELVETLRFFPGEEAAKIEVKSLDDPEWVVRLAALSQLRQLFRPPVAGRSPPPGKVKPVVEGLFDAFVRAADDESELIRSTALSILAETRDRRVVKLLRRKLMDPAEDVRFTAACLLTHFDDDFGTGELEAALTRLQQRGNAMRYFQMAALFAALERLSGETQGAVPPNPGIYSNLADAVRAERAYDELLEKWAVWWQRNRAN